MILSKQSNNGLVLERFLLETAIKHRNIGFKVTHNVLPNQSLLGFAIILKFL